jgi:hypothetical protein
MTQATGASRAEWEGLLLAWLEVVMDTAFMIVLGFIGWVNHIDCSRGWAHEDNPFKPFSGEARDCGDAEMTASASLFALGFAPEWSSARLSDLDRNRRIPSGQILYFLVGQWLGHHRHAE